MLDPLDQLCINTVRFLSMDAVQQANSGHPGMPLGAVPGPEMLREYGFSVEHVCQRALTLIEKTKEYS
jgi:transketolase